MKASDYLGRPVSFRTGRAFEPFPRRGFICLDVLPELTGKPWDDYALGAVHSLRPSWIRIIPVSGGIQLDSQEWRVTVWLNEDGTIASMEQEVVVGLPDDCKHGGDLNDRLFPEPPEKDEPNPEDEPR